MENDKKYKLSVPIPLVPFEDFYIEDYLKMLKKMKADRVFLFAPPLQASYIPDLEQYKIWSDVLKKQIALFNSHGIEAAFWMGHTIGHGGSLSIGNSPLFQQLVGTEGKEASGCYCPMDIKFKDYICSALAIIAESGVELIMLDDDFRVNLHPPEVSVGCFCPLHINAFREKTGIDLSREEIVEKALCGKPNEIRREWLKINGNSLLEFAGEIEHSIHEVNKNARIGLATAMTIWSNEGVDMRDLLLRFAGGTRMFLRSIGAPYWSKDPSNISWIIEYTRLQQHWVNNWDVELLSEGDSFPHTRFHCPAASLHAFQQGLFAAGFTSILNYSLVYAAQPEHEQGYSNRIADGLMNYDAICSFFPENYSSLGVNPLYLPNNLMNMVMPDKPQDAVLSWPDEPVAVRCLSRLGIPAAYEGDGPVFLSGYGAAGLPQQELEKLLSHGSVIDAVAAEWLVERGIDIGVSRITAGTEPAFEKYFDPEFSGNYTGDHIWLLTPGEKIYYRCDITKGARVISEFSGIGGEAAFPAVILYENALNQRFCVLMFSIYHARDGKQLLYNYARQEQLTRCLAWVNKKPLPVTVNAQPDMHVICRISPDEKRVAIAVQNCHLDTVKNPVLRLDPQIRVGDVIELLLPDADEAHITDDFFYKNDGTYAHLCIHCLIPPMGMLGVGLVQPN